MRVFGYEFKMTLRKVHPAPATDLRHQLFDAVDLTNQLWNEARKQKLFLNLWMNWETKKLEVTHLMSTPVERDEVIEKPVPKKKRGVK